MNWYPCIRPALFAIDPERAHTMALSALRIIPSSFFPQPTGSLVKALGMEFAHPVGLAAGLDKNGTYLDGLAKLGFSFIEIGTVTPRAQAGNKRPRLFRLPKANALINRMGFNNQGVRVLIDNVKKAQYHGILGINIGKNKATPLDRAVDDYVYGLRAVYSHAAYVTINISSPNTPQLRALQDERFFTTLMSQLRDEQLLLADTYQRYVPLVVKLSPDESDDSLKRMAHTIATLGLDGIIATNTTSNHRIVRHLPSGMEGGGVSGKPLMRRSTDCLSVLKGVVGDDVTLIGCGGIYDVASAVAKLKAGASLLQLYTGLIYQGPALVAAIAEGTRS